MVALTRSKVAASEYKSVSPALTSRSLSSDWSDEEKEDERPAAKTEPLHDVPTIPLFDFDLPLEPDAPNGSRVSAFNPAPYESLRRKLQQWFPELVHQDESSAASDSKLTWTGPPSSSTQKLSNSRRKNETDKNHRRGKAPADSPSTTSSKPHGSTQLRSKSSKRNGKAKQPDHIHLEVEFVPQVVSESVLLPSNGAPSYVPPLLPKSHPSFAVVALAPPDYKPDRSKARLKTDPDAEPPLSTDDTMQSEEDDDDLETLVLGHIVPSALKDTAHPLAHLDLALVTKEWIQLYGEVALVPPFLPSPTDVFGPSTSQSSPRNGTSTMSGPSSAPMGAGNTALASSTAIKTEPDSPSSAFTVTPEMIMDFLAGKEPDQTRTKTSSVAARDGVSSPFLLGVLSVQVGLEPAAMQYGVGDMKVDGFVADNNDLVGTGLEGSLNLARSLRQAIHAIVDWKHGFVELDMQAHTYWDRNESFYDLPPKQSTLARHLVLDKVDSVDLPNAAKTTSRKRKKPMRASGVQSRPGFGSEDDDEDRPACYCPNCQSRYWPAAAPPAAEPSRPKATGLPLGEKISGTDARLGDPASSRFLPLDTNIASLLEACRPPTDGPEVYPPSDIIPTPLLGYQARCLAWMIKKETVVDEDVSHLLPHWFPLRCKTATEVMRRRLQLEAEREAHLDAMQRGLSRSRRQVNVKAAQTGAAAAAVALDPAGTSTETTTGPPDGQSSPTLKREPFIDPVDRTFYFDQVSGLVSLRRFPCRPSEPGGALCESMGLGKTLESLSLIAAHPRPEASDLLSYDTSRSAQMIAELAPNERPFVSRATLVVCPAALVEQWMDEIRKHFRSRSMPNVTMSDTANDGTAFEEQEEPQQPGVVRYRHADFKWGAGSFRHEVRMLAKGKLTQPDIVVATYEELAFQLSESRRVPRNGNQVRTPLLEVLFWRIILDEAQIVAGASSKATDMVHELWRSNCWMVTGTPVTKGISDIQGIFAFLDHDPFAAPRFFREIVEQPFRRGCIEGIRRMRAILPRFVWRHTQAHVEEEIVLPPCKSEVLEIDLKHVERLFYDKEVNKYRETFAKRAAQGQATVSQPTFLVQLRQLLSHPQIADQLLFSNNFSRLSFVDLFRQFCQQAQSELDSVRMQMVSATLQLVWGHDFYDAEPDKRRWRGGRRALQQSDDIRKALQAALRVVDTALEDQSRARSASLARSQAEEQPVRPEERQAGETADDAKVNVDSPTHPSAEAIDPDANVESVDHQAWGGTDSAARINLTWEEASYWLRTLLRKHADPSPGDSPAEAIEPPARWDPERPTRTFFEKEFKNASDKQVDLNDPRFHLVVQDASADSMDLEELMAEIEAGRKGKGSSSPRKKQRTDASLQPGLLKKSRLRGNATQRKQMRVWLYKPKERLETTHARLISQQNKLPSKQHEVAFLREKLLELEASETKLDRQANAAASADTNDSATPVPAAECQICFERKEQIGVLPCYHSYCLDCIETICKNSAGRSNTWYESNRPRCPSCRLQFQPDRVTRVMERGRSPSTEGETEVIGDWSGKISGLILDLRARLAQDATHKAVIFSHWPKMLAFVRDALVQNGLSAVVFGGKEAAQAEALRAIRDDDDVNVIMVPFRATAGAAGLTLTSCDLAYLMEPALDAALEAQAVGRIHRIGQRRETTIIRVKMKDTIEDAVMRIADERSQRGMALATHADPSAATASNGGAQGVSTSSALVTGSAPSALRATETTPDEASTSGAPRVKTGESQGEQLPSASNLRERSIKSSVAASVGAARESDSTSLTMVEVGLILGFDVDEEKRKMRLRRESLRSRAFVFGLTPAYVDRLSAEAVDRIEQDLAMLNDEYDDDEDDEDLEEDDSLLEWFSRPRFVDTLGSPLDPPTEPEPF